MTKQVNIAVQILPLSTRNLHAYEIVDTAIEMIAASGLRYEVTPFETVIEGNYDEIMEVIKLAQQKCLNAGAIDLICNLKIHSSIQDVSIADKMQNYKIAEE